jgi:hypothetical protein
MTDTHIISPHVLEHPDGRVLCLPADNAGGNTRGLAVFVNGDLASRMAPEGFYPVHCSAQELQDLGESAQISLAVILGLGGDLEGSVLSLDAFVGVLLGEME